MWKAKSVWYMCLMVHGSYWRNGWADWGASIGNHDLHCKICKLVKFEGHCCKDSYNRCTHHTPDREACIESLRGNSDYSYLCSNDLQTLQAYRSCNVDHGCLCSHLNPPSRFPNTSRARLDTYIRNFLLFALQIYLMIDTIYRNLHYFHQAFSMLFYIQIPEGNHAGRFNFSFNWAQL